MASRIKVDEVTNTAGSGSVAFHGGGASFSGNISISGNVDFTGSLLQNGSPFVTLPTQDASNLGSCLLYTSPSPRDKRQSRMPSSA